MDDGKPLVVSISERDGFLLLQFVKTNEGLWMESTGLICKRGDSLIAAFNGAQIRLGSAASWLIRQVLGSGGNFKITKLGPDRLSIATSGWRGTFSARAE